jgi:hypothetical protein
MAINFPDSPSVDDTFTSGGITFTWNGSVWNSNVSTEISSDSTPQLGGALDGGTNNINNVGIITATTFSGNVTGNLTGNADTATTATNAQGLTGDPSIQVTNATVLGNLDVQGTTTTIDTAITAVDSLEIDSTTSNTPLIVQASQNNRSRIVFRNNIETGTECNVELINEDLRFVTNSGERLRITKDGNIGIGVTDPSEKLEVNGGKIFIDGGANRKITLDPGSNVTYDSRIDASHTLVFRSYVDGGVGVKTCTFNTNGHLLPGEDNGQDLGASNARWRNIYTGTISDSMGPLRRLGINAQTGAYSVTTTDAGKLIRVNNTGNITIPTGLNPGDMVSIVSHHASTNTIVEGSGLTLYNTADGSTGNRTLAARGVCTILWSHTDTAYISGSGLS